jgi:hypothetical protein
MFTGHTPEERAIIDAAPRFFDTTGIASPWSQRGFEIGPGWHNIVKEMAVAIEAIAPDVRCTQCKEKFGYLRVSTRMSVLTSKEMRERVRSIIETAVTASETTCEECGKEGRLVQGMWRRVLCSACDVKTKKPSK